VAIPPIADPTARPAIAPVLRPVVRPVVDFVVEVEVDVDIDVEIGANSVLEVEVAVGEVELFELSMMGAIEPPLGLELEAEVGDCVDEVPVGGAEMLEEEVVVRRSTINPGEGIFDTPT
jgi:hypothetical protein